MADWTTRSEPFQASVWGGESGNAQKDTDSPNSFGNPKKAAGAGELPSRTSFRVSPAAAS